VASETYQQFETLIRELGTASQVQSLLGWDQETMMPKKAAAARAEQMAFMAGIVHEKQTSDELGTLLEKLESEGGDDPVMQTNVREMRRLYNREVKLPTDLVKQIARATSLAQEAWATARADSDFPSFAPHLDRLLDLKREVADKIGWDTEPYDALMDEYEPGAYASVVQDVFDQLKKELVPLVQAIKDAPRQPDLSLLERHCPAGAQRDLGLMILELFDFDLDAGRLDVSTHPFCSGTTPFDVRLTTRYDEKYFPGALFGTMHECGHGLYEQGLNPDHIGTPAGWSVSLGIHESQSRTWENQVGRSRPFWQYFYAQFQKSCPTYADVALDDLYFAINNVRPSLIRVEADEVTYGLHIMLRFDLERQMVAGKLSTSEIPDAWNAKFEEMLGITPPNDREGCLQDIHWSFGTFGYFPTYQLGNLYSAQFFQAARQALPDLDEQIASGDMRPLRAWLRENIHQHGMRYRANELVKVVAGAELSHEPYIDYLKSKFKPLYGLS
jgi:carboxypeptidase Taq